MTVADPFSLPVERIPEVNQLLVDAIRTWADDEVIPVRRRIDEHSDRHALCRPLLETLCLEHGYQRAAWPSANSGDGRMNAIASAMCLDRSYVGSAAISDGRSGSDVENIDGTHGRHIATTARLNGDEWVVNGHKLWPTNSGGAADLFAAGLAQLGSASAGGLIEPGYQYTNNVAAVPSLHTAFSLLITLMLWPRERKWLRPLVASYPLAMTFSLIYTGEHYVADVLLGWAYKIAIAPSARAFFRHRTHQRSSAELGVLGRPHPETALVSEQAR